MFSSSSSSSSSNSSFCNSKDLVLEEFIRVSTKYKLQKLLGLGAFGKVYLCKDAETGTNVAVKIQQENYAKKEEAAMRKLHELDSDKNNIVKLIEKFELDVYLPHDRECHVCLVFEALKMPLFEYVKKQKEEASLLCNIQSITQQLLMALQAIQSIGMVHADIHHYNIMVAEHSSGEVRVKLIDFGQAAHVSQFELNIFKKCQATNFRAPEVILGLPRNEAMDMWSLGCVMAYVVLGNVLFDWCEYVMIRDMVAQWGMIGDHMLDKGFYTKAFFRRESIDQKWQLKTHDEYKDAKPFKGCNFQLCICNTISVDQRKTQFVMKTLQKCKETMSLLCLIKQMLKVDPEERITPTQALSSFNISESCKKFPDMTDVTPHMFLLLLRDLDEYTCTFKSLANLFKITSVSNVSCHNLDTNFGQENTVKTKNLQTTPDDAADAGIDKNTSAVNVTHGLDIKLDAEFVEVKTKKKCFRKLQKFFRRSSKRKIVPKETGSDDAADAGTAKNIFNVFNCASAVKVTHSLEQENAGFVEVKTQKKYFKKLQNFFRRSSKRKIVPKETGSDDAADAGTAKNIFNVLNSC